jgi:hypothetical protein
MNRALGKASNGATTIAHRRSRLTQREPFRRLNSSSSHACLPEPPLDREAQDDLPPTERHSN